MSGASTILAANNPCALRPLAKGRWKGQVGTVRSGASGRFARFETVVMGLRAALRCLDTYRRVHGLRTPAGIAGRWAPPGDRGNPTTAYARFLARRCGVRPDEPIPFTYEGNRRLLAAIVRFECGFDAVGPEVIAQAMALMAEEEAGRGRDPAPYRAPPAPLKPLARSKEVALGGGAAALGATGLLAEGRALLAEIRGAAEALPTADPACLALAGALLAFGAGVLANRLIARRHARR